MQETTSIKSKRKRSYTVAHNPQLLELALECLRKKEMSSYDAERHFGIPRRTLLDKLRGKHNKSVGSSPRLSAEVEAKIIKVLIAAAEYGSPLTLLDLRIMVHRYVEKNGIGIFNGNMPGEKWAYSLLKRYRSELSLRATANIKKVRAEKSCEELREYFKNLRETLKDVPMENILNYDETNLSDDPGKSKCIVKRGTKYPERIMNHTKGCISIMFSATADGALLPPYVVYKSKQMWTAWVTGGPPRTRYNHSDSGWFDSCLFEDWFISVIVPWARKLTGPKVIIGDNLASHLNPDVIALCEEHNIRFALLPTNSTHLTQPLDVCVYGPLKRMWRKILTNYKMESPSESSLNKCKFPNLLKQLMHELCVKKQNITSAFATTGIYPLNPEKVLKRLPDYKEVSDYGVEEAVIDYLKEIRAPKTKQKPVTNKKLKIEPGKSVSASDFAFTVNLDFKLTANNKKKQKKCNQGPKNCVQDTQNKKVTIVSDVIVEDTLYQNHATASGIGTPPKIIPENNLGGASDEEFTVHTMSKKITITPIKKQSQRADETDEESDYTVHDSSSDYLPEDEDRDDETEIEENVSARPEKENGTKKNVPSKVIEGGYIMVKFSSDKGTKYYVGRIERVEDENNYKVKFLRHKGGGKFAWPINDDICVINKIDIEEILPEPIAQRRGILTFDISKWFNFNIG